MPTPSGSATPTATPVATPTPEALDAATFEAGIHQVTDWLTVIGVAAAILIFILAFIAVQQVRK